MSAAAAVLLDASVMVALFDDRDRCHASCLARMGQLPPGTELLTTWPCVTESSYLLAPRNHLALLGWLHQGGARLVHAETHELGDWMVWMQRYSDQGKALVDVAEASLVDELGPAGANWADWADWACPYWVRSRTGLGLEIPLGLSHHSSGRTARHARKMTLHTCSP